MLVVVDPQKVIPGIPGVPVSEGVAPRGQIKPGPPLPHALVLGQVGRDIAAREVIRLQVVGGSGEPRALDKKSRPGGIRMEGNGMVAFRTAIERAGVISLLMVCGETGRKEGACGKTKQQARVYF